MAVGKDKVAAVEMGECYMSTGNVLGQRVYACVQLNTSVRVMCMRLCMCICL